MQIVLQIYKSFCRKTNFFRIHLPCSKWLTNVAYIYSIPKRYARLTLMRKQSILIEWLYVGFRFAVLAFGLPLFSLFVSFRLIHSLIRLSAKAFSHSHSALNSTIHMYIVFVLDVIFVFYLPKMECTIHSACPTHKNSMLNNNLCVLIYFVMFASFAVHTKPQKSF